MGVKNPETVEVSRFFAVTSFSSRQDVRWLQSGYFGILLAATD